MIRNGVLSVLLFAVASGSMVCQEPASPQGAPAADQNPQQGQQPHPQQNPTQDQKQNPTQNPQQKPPAPPPAPPTVVNLGPPPVMKTIPVESDVVVTDAQGKPQSGLTARDFSIRDDEQAEGIKTFRAYDGTNDKGEPPVQVLLVLDLVNTTAEELPRLRTQVASFLRENNGQLAHPVSLIIFLPQELQVQSEPTSDGNGLAKLVDDLEPLAGAQKIDPFGGSLEALGAIGDAVADKPGRKLLIWVGDGWQTPNVLGQTASPRDEDLNWSTLVSIVNKLREDHMVLFGGRDGESGHRGGAEGIRSAALMNLGNLGLEALAVRSGGSGFLSPMSGGLAGAMDKMVEEAGPYYRITYTASHADGQDTYHTIEVSVNRPGLTAHASEGYFNVVTGQK
ncbi:MAG: VWA domain-containing protein [Terracidiphilus sp.]